MQWLNKIADEAIARKPKGELLVESGGSPSGTYHFGHLRELVICDAIMLELRRRGRQARHIYYVDDLDGLRKIPPNVPKEFEKYLGQPLCDIPAPDGSQKSYADFFIEGLMKACELLGIEVEFIRSHQKYRAGFFVPAIEKALQDDKKIKKILEEVSGHKLDDTYSPVQIKEGEYLKKRPFVSLDKDQKSLTYLDQDGKQQQISYAKGAVKLDWRIDWPARWWLLEVDIEPAGRDHSTKGGSFDTGQAVCKDVFGVEGPLAVQYDFINLAGDNKKMSASAGTGLEAAASAQILPPEVLRFFILRSPPLKRLYFDPTDGLVRLNDEFEDLISKKDKTNADKQLIEIATLSKTDLAVSTVPFSHLCAAYQSSLKDPDQTVELLKRTTDYEIDEAVVKRELEYVDQWLQNWAPEEVKFELREKPPKDLSVQQKQFLKDLSEKVQNAPKDADGEWFHKAVYEIGQAIDLEPKAIFQTLYQALIGQDSGPRAGWFLSILPRDWLIKRLRLES